MVTSLYECKNKYYCRSRNTGAKFSQIIRFFAMDYNALYTAKLTNISVRSINTIYIKLRKKLLPIVKMVTPFNGIVELDECYFDSRRVWGNEVVGH